jgi:hypothetical protein
MRTSILPAPRVFTCLLNKYWGPLPIHFWCPERPETSDNLLSEAADASTLNFRTGALGQALAIRFRGWTFFKLTDSIDIVNDSVQKHISLHVDWFHVDFTRLKTIDFRSIDLDSVEPFEAYTRRSPRHVELWCAPPSYLLFGMRMLSRQRSSSDFVRHENEGWKMHA